ncbi:MAG: hypothetical protein MJ105_05440 [Lachnospiraceae bacterium]|nr:hypothetical protein [Lachnospiraceae bacterium]
MMKTDSTDSLEFIELEEEQSNQENAGTREKEEKPAKKSHKALIAYLIFLFVLLVAAGIFLLYAHSVIREYDRLHPDTYLQAVLEDLSQNGFSEDELATLAVGPFDDAAQIYEDANARMKGKELTAKFKSEDFTTNTLKYYIYADGEKVTEAYLTAEDSFTRLHVFQMSHYTVDDFNPPVEEKGQEAVLVTVPEGYAIYLNGKAVSDDYKVESIPVEELAYCAAYVENLPILETYEVTDIYQVKSLVIEDENGNEKYSWDGKNAGETYVVETRLGYEESEAPEEFQAMVFKMVKDYADFFSGDLPGCEESTFCIQYMFPADSMYLTLAEQYRREERRNFTSHTDNHYTDEQMDGYVMYSDDLVVCHVTMQKHMNVWGKQVVDPIDTIYYLVKDGDRWVIADMQ